MQLWNNLNTLWLLCLISILGIIGMLVLDGIWDLILLLLTALPLILAVYRARRMAKTQAHGKRTRSNI